MGKIVKYILLDILRNKVVLGYTLLLLVISSSVFLLDDNAVKGTLSLLNVILIIVPLVSVVFSTVYFYNSSEFIELVLAQPVRRNALVTSIYAGLSSALVLAFVIGSGIPLLVFAPTGAAVAMLLSGIVLTLVFAAFAMLASVMTRDKAKGIGAAIMLWLYFAIIYDVLILFVLFSFSDYPLEKAMVALSSLNPVDMARIIILLKLDISAIMGYTGAVFKEFLGTITGSAYAFGIMLLWIALPVWLSIRKFSTKDL
ncbi:MAG TPA: ABC transporter permease subunit [Chitinophagales bacterium]|nr:ABC transporter permease subunit [Chitinophagales bacterium]